VRRDVIHVDTWLRKEVVILPILSLYTQQDAFTRSKDSKVIEGGFRGAQMHSHTDSIDIELSLLEGSEIIFIVTTLG
jgi:hypothetical protein